MPGRSIPSWSRSWHCGTGRWRRGGGVKSAQADFAFDCKGGNDESGKRHGRLDVVSPRDSLKLLVADSKITDSIPMSNLSHIKLELHQKPPLLHSRITTSFWIALTLQHLDI